MQPGRNLHSTLHLLINPLNVYYQCYDCHFIIYLKNHPEIEAIEAMVLSENTDNQVIRAIITKHDKTQTDYINHQYDDTHGKAHRNIYQTLFEYSKMQVGKRIHIFLKFKTEQGLEVILQIRTVSPATPKHCRLVDPESHSADSSLPIMLPERNTIASPDSFASINGVKYSSPVKIWIPLFFKAIEGYYSEQFHMGILRAGIEYIMLVKAPERLDLGENWVYQAMSREIKYTITEINNDLVHVKRGVENIILQLKNGELVWKEIEYRHKTSMGWTSSMTIRFSPGIPASAKSHHINCTSEFSISMDDKGLLINGSAKAYLYDDRTILNLNLEQPEWAHEKPVTIGITEAGNRYRVETCVGRLIK